MLRLTRLREYFRTSLWALPTAIVVAAVLLGLGLIEIDRAGGWSESAFPLFGGTPVGARSALTVVAGSTLSLTGVVFSITMIVLQLASSQYSPRVLTAFLADYETKVALGVFLGTFSLSLTTLLAVHDGSGADDAFVPRIAVTASFVAALVSVGVLIRFIHHVMHSVRVSTIVRRLADETERELTRLPSLCPNGCAEPWTGPPGEGGRLVLAPRSGVVVDIDRTALVTWAAERSLRVQVTRPVGAYVTQGLPLLGIFDDEGDAAEPDLGSLVSVAEERDIRNDPVYGIMLLVDIALRALSPGVNDPRTAVLVLDQLERLLIVVSRTELPVGVYADAEGETRVWVSEPDWETYVRTALEEIIDFGQDSRMLRVRLLDLLADLDAVVSAPTDVLDVLAQRVRAAAER
ncbi:MAG: DUF2254 domain-containing protein [Anaerosomatales bacterium]|nr:DUF2254 domain-containing protein [Anaerosomatales bacterium]